MYTFDSARVERTTCYGQGDYLKITLTAEIFRRFNFRTNVHRPKILVSENCEGIYKAFKILIESVKISKNSRPQI